LIDDVLLLPGPRSSISMRSLVTDSGLVRTSVSARCSCTMYRGSGTPRIRAHGLSSLDSYSV